MFCPKCGSILMPRKDKEKKVLACSCGYVDKGKESKTLREVVPAEKKIEIVGDDEDKVLPLIEVECPTCKNMQAGYWLVQTRAGDEAETKFYKCTKCKHIWREYD
jgi:DNA-directed RNA polymerase subunit M